MADDIPLFPDDSNINRFRDFVNIQKELNDHLLTERRLYEQIGRISLGVEAKVVERRKNELRMMKLIRDKALEYNDLVQKRSKVTGQERDDLERSLDSLEAQIKLNKDMLSMSREASSIEMEMTKKIHEENTRWFGFASQQMNKLFGIRVNEYNLSKDIGEELIKQGVQSEKIAYTWGAILMMLKGSFEMFKKMDNAAWDFRKAMGMTRAESNVIRKDAQRIAIDNMAIGVTIESVYKSYLALGQVVGGVHNVSKSMAEDVAVMAAQLGISAEMSARFLRNMAAISKNTMESQVNSMYIAQNMSSAAGVQLDQVMGDIATKSSKTLTMMSRMPNVALRTAIELRRMGTDLNSVANSSRHILDFTENMNEEMNASVLLGRSINLQRARELAYRRDLEGSTKEILRITKSINFENLDVFQQEAFAAATGKTVEELLKMLQTSRQLEHIKRAGTPEQKEQLALYEKMRSENEKAAKARAKDSSALLRTMNNQTRLAAISAKWNEILAKAQEFLLPVIDNMLALVIPALDIARGLFAWGLGLKVVMATATKVLGLFKAIAVFPMTLANFATKFTKFPAIFNALTNLSFRLVGVWLKVGAVVSRVANFFKPIITVISAIGKFLAPIGKFFTGIVSVAGKILAPLGKVFGFLGKFGGILGAFGKFIPVIGWVIAAFQFIGNLIARMKGIGDAFNKGFFNGLWFGLKAVVGALYDTLIKPFVDAFKWIWHFFGGKSPSLLGQGILDGIVSVGTMMFKAITMPWQLAFKAIMSIVPGLGNMVGTIGKMVLSSVTSIVGVLKTLGPKIFSAFLAPYKMAFEWIINKFAGLGKSVGKLFGKGESVEKKATAAYIPAVTVTPKGTEVVKPKGKAVGTGKEEEKVAEPMSEATGQKIVVLLEKILAKDSNVHMDGQLLSTHLARQTEFRGGYGVNKVA